MRKLGKIDKLAALIDADVHNVERMDADIPTTEFRTTDGKLSTWIIDSLDNLNDAILAIAVSSSAITKMDFIIIDTELLSKYNLEYKQTYAGQDIAVPDLQDTHYDIVNISIEKLVICTQVYQSIVKEDSEYETYIVRVAAGEIKDILKNAMKDHRIDESKATRKLKEELSKLKVG